MTSGKWMILDSNTREIYGLFQDGVEALHTVRFSPDGKFLALGSRDGILYIYQVSDDFKKYHRMGRCLVSYLTLITTFIFIKKFDNIFDATMRMQITSYNCRKWTSHLLLFDSDLILINYQKFMGNSTECIRNFSLFNSKELTLS